MKEIMKLSLILFITCFVAALLLAVTNDVTIDRILEQRYLANELAKQNVLPSAHHFEDLDPALVAELAAKHAPVSEIYVGYNEADEIIGYVFKSLPVAFGGAMEVVTGITVDGEVTGLRVGNHQETPGLGAKAKDEAFYEQYSGKSALSLIGVVKTPASGNDVQAITGATITTDAVTVGANASISAFTDIIGGQ